MKVKLPILTAALVCCAFLASLAQAKPSETQPNILFITLDDLNYDSVGSYGSTIPNISPHIDSLAEEGLRFEFAYNQTSSCVPSRNTYFNGRYPHTSGMLSFYNVEPNFSTLTQLLRESGYYAACINKPRDSSMTNDYAKYWDSWSIMRGPIKRFDQHYAERFQEALDSATKKGKPFYAVVNIADPHKPFYNDPTGIEQGFDKHAPSIIYGVDDVTIPPFLPDNPKIREEMRNYYNSVKRADDCVGAVLDILKKNGLAESTIIMLISDHGMPLPYAKSSVYPDGLRTPWIVKWPGKLTPGTVDSQHLISAIDYMPTILDIAGIPHPDGLQGKSILPLLEGEIDPKRDHVFGQFNDNAGGLTFPMRAIHTKDHLYIFNAWGTGKNKFTSASTWHQAEGVIKKLAKNDPEVAKRYNFLIYRTVEEFYDLQNDPHALINLIDRPEHQARIDEFRLQLESWMHETDDYLIEAFAARDDLDALQEIYLALDAAALKRAETYSWKRYKNRAGGTGKNKKVFRLGIDQ